MRLFIGVELPDDVKAAAGAATGDTRERLGRVAPRASIRWVDSANLHITLWFLGEIQETRARQLMSVLESPFRTKVFDVRLEGFGAFPERGTPHVFWIGVASGASGLIGLHGEVQERILPLGFQPERRPYAPHLTVARVKDIRRSAVRRVRKLLAQAPMSAMFPVKSVTLFQSRLSPSGSRYESLMRIPLQ
jgi:2'-5' RNA ligase